MEIFFETVSAFLNLIYYKKDDAYIFRSGLYA